MKYRWLVILACFLVTACSPSTKDEAGKAGSKNAEKVAEKAQPVETESVDPGAVLLAEYDLAYGEFVKKMRSAKPAERAEVTATNPTSDFAEKFRTLAAGNPDSEVEATALAWLASYSDDAEEKDSTLNKLMENYPDSPSMKEAARGAFAAGKPSQASENILRRILKDSPHQDARGAAAHYLVSYLDRYRSLVERVDELAENPAAVKSFGEDGLEYLRNLKVTDAEMEKLYETIASDYSDVVVSQYGRETKIGETAKTALFEIKNLSMGCLAPDIVGSDMDGKEFALSDYRGKVVMLDFWGDW